MSSFKGTILFTKDREYDDGCDNKIQPEIVRLILSWKYINHALDPANTYRVNVFFEHQRMVFDWDMSLEIAKAFARVNDAPKWFVELLNDLLQHVITSETTCNLQPDMLKLLIIELHRAINGLADIERFHTEVIAEDVAREISV